MTLKKVLVRSESRRIVVLCGVTASVVVLGACQPELDEYSADSGALDAAANGGRAGANGAAGAAIGIDISAPPSTSIDSGCALPAAGAGGAAPYLDPASKLSCPGVGTPPTDSTCLSPAPSANGGAAPLFCDQMVWNVAPASRTLYSWTTAEQAAELRSERVLLTRTETPGLGRGYAFTSIDALAALGTAPENKLLEKLSQELFVKVRYAWPNAWATRMGWPGEDYGDQLLRIVLKPEAWILVVSDQQGIAVIDMKNQLVSIADAVAHSERIGAVYFTKRDVSGSGTFRSCSGGYREFIVGNEAMIEEWSLGTDEIRARILADAELIEDLFGRVRASTAPVDPGSFNRLVVCNWDYSWTDNDVARYENALSIPSEYYVPLPETLANLSQTLRASLFDPDPLVVRPGG